MGGVKWTKKEVLLLNSFSKPKGIKEELYKFLQPFAGNIKGVKSVEAGLVNERTLVTLISGEVYEYQSSN